MSASLYANQHNRGSVVNQLDAMILAAAQIDVDFNVNVTTAPTGSSWAAPADTPIPPRERSARSSPRSSTPVVTRGGLN